MDEQFLQHHEQEGADHKVNRQTNPPKLTFEQYAEARKYYELLQEIPRMSDLARKWGIPASTIVNAMRNGVKQYDRRMHK